MSSFHSKMLVRATTVCLLAIPYVTLSYGQEATPVPAPSPSTPSPQDSPQPAPTGDGAKKPVTEAEKAEIAEIRDWLLTYHAHPDHAAAIQKLRRLAELGEFAVGANGWTFAAVVAELISLHPEQTEVWCVAFDSFPEQAKFWVHTGVWMTQRPEALASLKKRSDLAVGAPGRIEYKFLEQKPQSILDRRIRGEQQIAMLLHSYAISKKSEYLDKLIEGLSDPLPDEPNLSDRGRARLGRVVEAVKVALARGCRRDESITAHCLRRVDQLSDPQKGRLAEALAIGQGVGAIADAPPVAPPRGEAAQPGTVIPFQPPPP